MQKLLPLLLCLGLAGCATLGDLDGSNLSRTIAQDIDAKVIYVGQTEQQVLAVLNIPESDLCKNAGCSSSQVGNTDYFFWTPGNGTIKLMFANGILASWTIGP